VKLVIDANILLAALIKKATTRDLLLKEELQLYAPDVLIEEFFDNTYLIAKKTNTRQEELAELLQELLTLSHVTVIPKKGFISFVKKAKSICPDKDDVPYFAIALYLRCPIWSNDKRLKEQTEIKIYTTKEVLKF
jgi:predicted nucleic acid-binding protein